MSIQKWEKLSYEDFNKGLSPDDKDAYIAQHGKAPSKDSVREKSVSKRVKKETEPKEDKTWKKKFKK